MQPAIRPAESFGPENFLSSHSRIACRYGCRHSTAAPTNAGHLTCSTVHGGNSGRTVTADRQNEEAQQDQTWSHTHCDGYWRVPRSYRTAGPCRPATPTRHGRQSAGEDSAKHEIGYGLQRFLASVTTAPPKTLDADQDLVGHRHVQEHGG